MGVRGSPAGTGPVIGEAIQGLRRAPILSSAERSSMTERPERASGAERGFQIVEGGQGDRDFGPLRLREFERAGPGEGVARGGRVPGAERELGAVGERFE